MYKSIVDRLQYITIFSTIYPVGCEARYSS
nr:MAG TPA: hypothetical protein [Bacteriophage sp.]